MKVAPSIAMLALSARGAFAFLTPSRSAVRQSCGRTWVGPSSRTLGTTVMGMRAPPSSTSTATDYSNMTVVQLKDLLREMGETVSGKKWDLIKRLSALETSSSSTGAGASRDESVSEVAATRKQVEQQPKSANSSPVKTRTMSTSAAAATSNNNGFQDMGVPSVLVNRLLEMGLTHPTPIQKGAIPEAIEGRDVMGLAQTGTGKTLAFGVPLVAQMLQESSTMRLKPRAVRGLVLAPTRELANQIAVQLAALTQKTNIKTFVVVGGQNIKTQINKLQGGTDLLVATPGRLIDLMDRRALTLSDTSFLVLDEADQMLDMGFLPSLRKICKMLPPKRQTMLFSATMNNNMNEVANSYLNKNPVRIEVARAGKTADKVTQELHYVAKADKVETLLNLLNRHRGERTIVFGRTKHGMEKLSKKLIAAGIKAGSIHGNKSQSARDKAIMAFKTGEMKVLVATDVAARGLDIPDVKYVYNYELPNVAEAYVHRIGRTARAGKEGAAIAFCSMEEMDDLLAIQKVTGVKIPVVSGTPWSKSDTKYAKDSIKNAKQVQQDARKKSKPKPLTGGAKQTRFRR